MRQSHCLTSLIQRQPRQGHGLRPLPALDRSGVCWIVPLDIDLGAEVKMTSHTDFLTLPDLTTCQFILQLNLQGRMGGALVSSTPWPLSLQLIR